MASTVHSRDGRNMKFAPVYEAIDEYNYRKAMTFLEKRDISSTSLGKALKSLVLLKSGFRDEAMGFAMEVLRGKPTDVQVLAALGEVFTRTEDMGYYIQLFDGAATEKPDDEALGRLAVYAWARVEDYKKLQATALRLAKTTGRPEYSAWAAVALHAQASATAETARGPAPFPATGGGRGWGTCPPTAPSEAASLKMAEILLTRALDGLKPHARDSETLGLWVHTLVRQRRSAEALAALAPNGKYAFIVTRETTVAAALSPTSDDGGRSSSGAGATPGPVTTIPLQERAYEEDVLVTADGHDGRPKAPGPLQPVESARYVAYLSTNAALEAEEGSGGNGGSGIDSAKAWRDAATAYATLLTRFDPEDWAYHQGYAYATSRAAAHEVASAEGSGADAAIRAACRPLSSAADGITANSSLDVLLAPALARLTALGSGNASTGDADDGKAPGRGVCLGVIQLAAARLELATRASTASTAPGSLRFAAGECIPALQSQLGALLLGYARAYGSKACCFSDMQPFLPALLPVDAAAPQPAISGDLRAELLSFLSPDARILSMPYAPLSGAPGSASDTAPAQAPLRLSASLPAELPARVFSAMQAVRDSCAPDAELAAELTRMAAEARNAAVAAAAKAVPETPAVAAASAPAPAKASGGGKKKDGKKGGSRGKKGGKGSGGKAQLTLSDSEDDDDFAAAVMTPAAGHKSETVDPSDPHGVAGVLNPVQQLLYDQAAQARLSAVRSRVRRYATALQLLRYGGKLGTDDATIQSIVTAWSHTLPMQTLAAASSAAAAGDDGNSSGLGTNRDVGEGDDLLLVSVHLLWQRGLDALRHTEAAPTASTADDNAAAAGLGEAAIASARAAFLEALLLLQAGIASSPFNPQFRLASARTYGWLGCAAGAFQQWRELRIKHSLSDALSHVAAPHVARFSWPEVHRKMADELCAYHRNSAREAPDYVRVALREGTLSSALDVQRFRVRLRESGPAALVRSSLAHLHLIFAASRGPSEAQAHLQRLVVTGEIPDAWVDPSPGALARLRDNDDRENAACWDAPSPAALASSRWGVDYAGFTSPTPGSAGYGAGAGVDGLGLSAAVDALQSPSAPALFTGVVGYGGYRERELRAAARTRLLRLRGYLHAALLALGEGASDRAGPHLDAARALLAPTPGPGASPDSLPSQLLSTLTLDFASPALAVVDTGVSGCRPAVMAHCAAAVLAAVDGAHAAVQGAQTSSADQLASSRSRLEALAESVSAASAAVASELTYGGSSAVNPRGLAEATLLAQHTLVYAIVALGFASKALSAAKAKAGKAGKAATKDGELESTQAGVAASASSCHRALSSLRERVKAVHSTLDGEITQAPVLAVVAGGFDAASCVTSVAREAYTAWATASVGVSKKTAAAATASASGLPVPGIASGAVAGLTGTGAAFVESAHAAWAAALRKSVAVALEGVGACYTVVASNLAADLEDRLQSLKSLSKST